MSLEYDRIPRYIDQLEREAKALHEEAIKISWYMRGGITLDDAMMLSQEDRKVIDKLIKENLEVTKKTGISFI